MFLAVSQSVAIWRRYNHKQLSSSWLRKSPQGIEQFLLKNIPKIPQIYLLCKG